MTLRKINQRSNEIFKQLVESYVETGEPVGSRTLSRKLPQSLSPATIRNIMADLEDAGLLYAPHTSAGRLPTDKGMRYFISALLEVGDLDDAEKEHIEQLAKKNGQQTNDLLTHLTEALSGLSNCASLVMAPKIDSELNHIEFVRLSNNRALVVLVNQDGMVENRIITLGEDFTPSILAKASQYLNQHIYGKTLNEAISFIGQQKIIDQSNLDELTSSIVKRGLAIWSDDDQQKGSLIVKGRGNLLNSVQEIQDLEKIRVLFNTLDTKDSMSELLTATLNAEGVQIFIGSENELFSHAGCSMVIAPYKNSSQKIIGAVGVVGPQRMNYGRIIPLVDYTSKLISKLIR
jgi:heat-inducible transcriptional repressor